VSKVLNGRADVSAELRSRIMGILEEVDYRRRPGNGAVGHDVSGLRAGGQRAVGQLGTAALVDLVLSSVEGTWSNRALSGVESAAVQAGVDLVVSVARVPDDAWLARLLARNLRGAVLALVDTTGPQLATLAAANVPVVLLDPVRQPPESVASVGATNWGGGRAAAEHLIALGHTRFAVIGGRREHLYSQARIDGFRSAVLNGSLELPADRVVHADWRRADAAALSADLLRTAARPTAIFACSDTMALGVYDAAAELGLGIPDEVSVVGFDDLPEAQWMRPQLTTVQQPIAEMGAAALRMLLRIRSGAHPNVLREELATTLVVRGSTGKAR